MPDGNGRRRDLPTGAPVWPWIVGGVAVVGLVGTVAYAATRKPPGPTPPGPTPPTPTPTPTPPTPTPPTPTPTPTPLPDPVPVPPTPEPTPTPPTPTPTPEPQPEPQPEPSLRDGKPKNVSGDAAGYNTKAFANPLGVRGALRTLGYTPELNDLPLNMPTQPGGDVLIPSPYVLSFQRDWNNIVDALAAGRIARNFVLPMSGMMTVPLDGVAGKNVLNGIEIGVGNQQGKGIMWNALVAAAKG